MPPCPHTIGSFRSRQPDFPDKPLTFSWGKHGFMVYGSARTIPGMGGMGSFDNSYIPLGFGGFSARE
jgi:hypothetical protein